MNGVKPFLRAFAATQQALDDALTASPIPIPEARESDFADLMPMERALFPLAIDAAAAAGQEAEREGLV